ncbi:hypothetical protein GA610_05085 [Bifidobacterium adolescentis]|nr:hypothetical protein GA610_05085 [Bifidobacterium adolescentis]
MAQAHRRGTRESRHASRGRDRLHQGTLPELAAAPRRTATTVDEDHLRHRPQDHAGRPVRHSRRHHADEPDHRQLQRTIQFRSAHRRPLAARRRETHPRHQRATRVQRRHGNGGDVLVETIEIWRGQPTTDTDGNPIQGKPVPVGTFQALVEPNSTTDQTEENANPQTIEYTIRIRGSQPTGIQTTDLIKVRGILLPVKGKPQVWNNIHGRHIGDVITVGERKG